jgi:hypothetical protein
MSVLARLAALAGKLALNRRALKIDWRLERRRVGFLVISISR